MNTTRATLALADAAQEAEYFIRRDARSHAHGQDVASSQRRLAAAYVAAIRAGLTDDERTTAIAAGKARGAAEAA